MIVEIKDLNAMFLFSDEKERECSGSFILHERNNKNEKTETCSNKVKPSKLKC